MKEETLFVVDRLNAIYEYRRDPKIQLDGERFIKDVEKIAKTSEKVIEIFSEEEMTYEEAYATLKFIHESLLYKSQKVNL